MKASAPLNTGTTIESRDGGADQKQLPGILLDLRFGPEFPSMDSGLIDNIHLPVTNCNRTKVPFFNGLTR